LFLIAGQVTDLHASRGRQEVNGRCEKGPADDAATCDGEPAAGACDEGHKMESQ
jgi:hypothetical protein